MRSQDGSYLVEFIHRENMLLQVILLMSGAQLSAPSMVTALIPKRTFFGGVGLARNGFPLKSYKSSAASERKVSKLFFFF